MKGKLTLQKASKLLLGIFFIVGVAACQPDTCFYSYQSVPHDGWTAKDTVRIPLPAIDSTMAYTLAIEAKYNAHFVYKDLYVELTQQLDSPAFHRVDTVCLSLFNHQGVSKGDGLFVQQLEKKLYNIRLHKGQHGAFIIRHIQRSYELHGIEAIGIRIDHRDKVKPNPILAFLQNWFKHADMKDW